FRFTPEDLDYLGRFLDAPTCEWLAGYRFTGRIDAYREGELYFTGSPVLTVEASFAEAVVLETLVLSVLNHDSAVASAAARMDVAAGDRTLIEVGGRACGPGGLDRRVRRHLQPGGGAQLRHPHGGHRVTRVHPRP